MSDRYVLYGGRITRATIVEMVLCTSKLDYELHEIDIFADEQHSESYRAISPMGHVPALVTPSGEVLFETPAINLHLADKHQLQHIAPPMDNPLRARFLNSLFYISGEIEPALKRYFYPWRYAADRAQADAVRDLALQHARDRLQVLESQIDERGPFCLGNRSSLLDMMLAYWAVAGGAALVEGFAGVQGAVTRISADPEVARLLGYVEEAIEHRRQTR